MEKGKLLLAAALIAGAVIAAPSPAQALDAMDFERGTLPITVHVDGEFLPMDVDPIIVNGRTMVPLRAAGEAVGATVNWDQASQTATADVNGKHISFTIGSNTYYVGNTAYSTDVAPVNKSGRTLLPLRAFGDACGVSTVWDNDMRDVQIDTPAENALVKPLIPAGLPEDIATMIEKYYIQNDVNDPLVGNWRTESVLSANPGGGATTQTKYLFIRKDSGKYKAIKLGVEQATFYTNTGFCVQDLNGVGSGSAFMFEPNEYNSHGYNGDSIIYYRIPGNGDSEMLSFTTEKYERVGNDLILTAKEMGILGWQSQNERYTRF